MLPATHSYLIETALEAVGHAGLSGFRTAILAGCIDEDLLRVPLIGWRVQSPGLSHTYRPGRRTGELGAPSALTGTLRGETLEFTADGQFVLVGTTDGKLATLPAAPDHDFWQHRDGDPETGLHQNANMLGRSWYGGCRTVDATCFGGFCPAKCPTGAVDAVHTLDLGSPVRKLLRL